MKRKICFVTGSRAEYGLLSGIIRMVDEAPDCQLQIIATNMHLMPEFGETYREIERDGFHIDMKVAMPKASDDARGVVASMAVEMQGINDAFSALQPDIVVILGDRYEMLVVATVAMLHRIPIAHIHGGEVTEGAYDDCIRHAITKMSNLHFTSTEEYRQRVVQLGESSENVYYVGAPGVENIRSIPLIDKADLEKSLGITLSQPTIMATYHPVTLGGKDTLHQIREFLSALDEIPDVEVIFTMPNSDEGTDAIRHEVIRYCNANPDRCKAFDSLGVQRYLSLMHHATAVVGNSSSGIIEVPSAGIPTLNIGDRQKGRVHGPSVLDCADDRDSIVAGLHRVLSDDMRKIARTAPNPYDKPGTARAIFEIISTTDLDCLSRKRFHDL